MNPFNAHPQQQGITYTAHFVFAMGIALRLFRSVIAFALHALFPFIDIRNNLDLEATTSYLDERNQWIAKQKTAATSIDHPVRIEM